MGSRVGLVYDERMCAHENVYQDDHPECPARITSIYEVLKSNGVVERCVQVDAREATPEELSTVHTEDHITLMQDVGRKSFGKKRRKRLQKSYNSIYFSEGSTESALLAAGSVIEVATQVAEGKLAAGACVVRPPGHHAEAGHPMGFCLFNNVAVAVHILVHQKIELGIKKVLIVDWDVHHGNGTQHMFWTDPQVLYFSVHRFDNGNFYPSGNDGNSTEVGDGEGKGYNINVPWPKKGYGDGDYMAVWKHILMPVAHQFNPDIVLISAGFDSAKGDPLGNCNVSPGGYFQMTRQLMELANGRIVLALEGGYNLDSISNSYLSCMQALLGDAPVLNLDRSLLPNTLSVLKQVRDCLQKYWPVLATEMLLVPPTPAPSLAAEELTELVVDSEKLDLDNERHGQQLPSQPSFIPITDLVDLLSKLSTWEGSPNTTTHEEPTSSTVVNQEANHTVEKGKKAVSPGETSYTGVSGEDQLEKEIGPEDINVILHLSGADSSSLADEGDGGRGGDGQVEDGWEAEEVETEVWQTHATKVTRTKGGKVVEEMEACGYVSSDLSSTREARGVRGTVKPSYVWYASYGTNMYKPRFMCYIQGGKVEGMSRFCRGCRDKSPPAASEWLSIPNRLFFGHESTRLWGLGGVAFIDPVPETGVVTHVRIYKITTEQFNDVFSQENSGRVERAWVTNQDVDRLRNAPLQSLLNIFEDNWYGTVKYLGEKDGFPILTFTCPESHMEKFRSGEFGTFAPPEAYRNTIVKGLAENLGLTEEQAHDYVSSAILPKQGHK